MEFDIIKQISSGVNGLRIIRYLEEDGRTVRLAAVDDDDRTVPLKSPDFMALVREAERDGVTPLEAVRRQTDGTPPVAGDWSRLRLLAPVEAPEVWAAGVTYERSKAARNEESNPDGAAAETVYDKVYRAERPEPFLKSTAARTVGPGEAVCLRSDSSWQVPEPDLGLVLDRAGRILGYTVGNDMSCRDIEGENPLYLPQAKIWRPRRDHAGRGGRSRLLGVRHPRRRLPVSRHRRHEPGGGRSARPHRAACGAGAIGTASLDEDGPPVRSGGAAHDPNRADRGPDRDRRGDPQRDGGARRLRRLHQSAPASARRVPRRRQARAG